MDQATLDALVGRRELEDILSLRPTRVAEIIKTPEERFPEPVKVLEDGTRLWDVDEILPLVQGEGPVMAATEKKKVVHLALEAEDIDMLRSAITYTLDGEIKTGRHKRHVHLYRLSRRLYRARLKLEE